MVEKLKEAKELITVIVLFIIIVYCRVSLSKSVVELFNYLFN